MILSKVAKPNHAESIPRPKSASEKLRRDRRLGVLILVVFAGLMALAIWAASFVGGVEGIDYNQWIVP